jgi:predicted DNA-binding protein YlxM (UPF0122 family)
MKIKKKPIPNKVDLKKALDLKLNHNLSYNEIAEAQGVSKQAIQQRLKPLLPTKATEEYKANRPDILAEAQLKLLLSLDQTRLKKASVNNLAYAFKEFFACERTERGQSNSNIALHVIVEELERTDRERREKERNTTIEPATPTD